MKAYKITPTTPPTIVSAWSVTENGQGSPWVTTTDGTNNAIVWVVGAQGDGQLHGYDGDTGAVIYPGADVMSGTRKWNSGIVACGSIYVANDNKVYAFRVPGGTPTPTPTPTATPTATATVTATVTPTASRNCHGNWESDSNTQTNAHSEIACDTEAAADSTAKAGRSVSNSSKCSGSASSQPAHLCGLPGMGRLKFQTDCDVEGHVPGGTAGNYARSRSPEWAS